MDAFGNLKVAESDILFIFANVRLRLETAGCEMDLPTLHATGADGNAGKNTVGGHRGNSYAADCVVLGMEYENE